jgi:coenzyme F420-0:L-glutamate ligase/coenzyme F420-1:gamma-L-glutamate ligase
MTLTLSPIREIPLIQAGDDLPALIFDGLNKSDIEIEDGDILVVTQKIVSKSEDRLVNLTQVQVSEKAKKYAAICEKDPRFVELVLQESNEVLRCRPGTIIVEHRKGFICANAGIDHSNVKGPWGNEEDWVLLLPKDPDASAEKIRSFVQAKTKKDIGVMIIDSHGRAWRIGTVGVCIGLSGFPAVVDMRGQTDMFGYKLRVTQVAAADELAAAASLIMGQATERIPVVHVRGFPYPLRESHFTELVRPRELDMFR